MESNIIMRRYSVKKDIRIVEVMLYIPACKCGLWLHCLVGLNLVGCGHKIVLIKNMS